MLASAAKTRLTGMHEAVPGPTGPAAAAPGCETGEETMRSDFTASDGIRLACHIDDFTDPWAPARPLLLLHAAMGSARRWYAAVPKLSRHFRVIRLDLRG